jgi:hypothetical protein
MREDGRLGSMARIMIQKRVMIQLKKQSHQVKDTDGLPEN